MQAANHVEFSGAFAHALFSALINFFEGEGIGAGGVVVASKSAQFAVGHAHVGGIDVPVDVEIGDVPVAFFAYVIGQPAHGEEIGRAIQRDAVFLQIYAHVGGIDVPVDVEIGDVPVAFFAYVIGQPAHGEEIGRAIQRDAVFL